MKVSSSGYYEWLTSLPSNRAIENQQLTKSIEQVFVSNRNVYGTRRIAKILAKNDILISKRRIGKLMASVGLVCKTKRRFKVTTDSKHNNPISPNTNSRLWWEIGILKIFDFQTRAKHKRDGIWYNLLER